MFPIKPLHSLVLPTIQILYTHSLFLFIRSIQPLPGRTANLGSQAIILLINIHLPPILSYTQFFFLRDLAHSPIVTLVTDGSRGSQKEGTGDHGADEGEAEEEEWMSREVFPVLGSNGVLMRRWSELFGWKGWHFLNAMMC